MREISDDNYYLIRQDREGFFVPVLGFASHGVFPIVRGRDMRFVELLDAMMFADRQITEFGTQVADECYSTEPVRLLPVEGSEHYYGCAQASTDETLRVQFPDCICKKILSEWNEPHLPVTP
jgi:hypothetical protein